MWEEEEEKQGMEHRKLPRVTSDEGTEDNRSTRFARAQREREREGMRTVHSVDRTVSHSAMRNGRF